MFSRFFARARRDEDIAASLYGAIVAQARSPILYADIGVPDSVAGRFEMVLLHVALVSRRFATGGEDARAMGQGVFDAFCRDMDNSLREMGIADLKVPKHMRNVGEAYFGRAATYESGLSSADVDSLAESINRTVFAGDMPHPAAHALGVYALAAAKGLDAQSEDEIVASGPEFPNLVLFVPEELGR